MNQKVKSNNYLSAEQIATSTNTTQQKTDKTINNETNRAKNLVNDIDKPKHKQSKSVTFSDSDNKKNLLIEEDTTKPIKNTNKKDEYENDYYIEKIKEYEDEIKK